MPFLGIAILLAFHKLIQCHILIRTKIEVHYFDFINTIIIFLNLVHVFNCPSTIYLSFCICILISRFLYSDEVQIGPETVMTTLYTAKKYAVPALEAHCVEFLTKHLRADNAFMLLTQVTLMQFWPVMTILFSKWP